METNKYFWIGINTPSSKNNKEWVGTALITSERVRKWQKNTLAQWVSQKEAFLKEIEGLPKPLHISFLFVRRHKRTFDYINACQAIQDEMVEQGWLTDDNCNELIPYFEAYIHDKQFHGCLIRVLKTKPDLK